MLFDFGIARDLYARHVHPRVLLGPAEWRRLQRQVKTAPNRALLAAIGEEIRPYVEAVLAAPDIIALLVDKEHPAAGFGGNLICATHNMALVGALTENADALEAARRVLLALPAAESQFYYDSFIHGRVHYAMLAFDLLYDRLTPDERSTFASWAVTHHVRQIINDRKPVLYKAAGQNLMFGKVLSAVHAALAVEGEAPCPSLSAERADLAHLLEATINVAIASDGYPEEDGGYGTEFLCWIFMAAMALRRAGEFDALAACPRLAQSGRAVLHMLQPWGTHLATTGDCGGTFGRARQYLLPGLAAITGDRGLWWFYGVMKDAACEVPIARGMTAPAEAVTVITLPLLGRPLTPERAGVPTAFCDRRRGFVSFRSGWDQDATFLIFDGSQRSPGAQGHFHASSGHFSVSALGEYFAIDTGRYNMEQDQHNLVLVDGRSGRSTHGEWTQMNEAGVLTDYLPGAFVDFAAADSSHQHDCYWARRFIGLVKGPRAAKGAAAVPAYVWTVEDINKANDYREFWWTLNTSPCNTIALTGDRAAVIGGRHGHRLEAAFVLPDPSAYPKPHTLTLAQDIKTCGSYKYNADPYASMKLYKQPEDAVHHSAFVRPRLIAKVAGYNGRFMSLLIPRPKGAPAAAVTKLPTLDNALAARIAFGDVEDTVIFAYEHHLLEAAGIVARGQWCVVRRARRTGRVLAWALGHGTQLEVEGKTQKITK